MYTMFEIDWAISIPQNDRKPLISAIFLPPEGWNWAYVAKM